MSKNKSATQASPATPAPAVTDPLAKYSGLTTKSAKIRAMFGDGMTRSQIAKALNIRYQHVRNVLTQPVKRPA